METVEAVASQSIWGKTTAAMVVWGEEPDL